MYALIRVARFDRQIDPYWNDDDGVLIGFTIDGVHYHITEPRPFSKKYSSFKFGGKAGLSYAFVISTVRNKLACIIGPYPAAVHDREIFRAALQRKIEEKQRARGTKAKVLADDGYFAHDLLEFLSFRNELDPSEIAWFKDRALSRHERFNGLTKNFKSMKELFHHDRGENPNREHPRHRDALEAICVAIQYELDLGITSLLDPYPS